ncbi:hypothetical protein P3342_007132 [Pyrenophora teres f. teres]|nr:hypothetical protein P3342_007132 [Pyrenophora teres f. teres]
MQRQHSWRKYNTRRLRQCFEVGVDCSKWTHYRRFSLLHSSGEVNGHQRLSKHAMYIATVGVALQGRVRAAKKRMVAIWQFQMLYLVAQKQPPTTFFTRGLVLWGLLLCLCVGTRTKPPTGQHLCPRRTISSCSFPPFLFHTTQVPHVDNSFRNKPPSSHLSSSICLKFSSSSTFTQEPLLRMTIRSPNGALSSDSFFDSPPEPAFYISNITEWRKEIPTPIVSAEDFSFSSEFQDMHTSDFFELKDTASECSMDSAYQSQSSASRRGARKPEVHRQDSRSRMSSHFVGSDIYSPTMSSDNYSAFQKPWT